MESLLHKKHENLRHKAKNSASFLSGEISSAYFIRLLYSLFLVKLIIFFNSCISLSNSFFVILSLDDISLEYFSSSFKAISGEISSNPEDVIKSLVTEFFQKKLKSILVSTTSFIFHIFFRALLFQQPTH